MNIKPYSERVGHSGGSTRILSREGSGSTKQRFGSKRCSHCSVPEDPTVDEDLESAQITSFGSETISL